VVELFPWLEKSRIEDGPKMDDPSEQDKPEDCRQTKLDDRHQQSTLEQLSQTGNKETAERGKNVTRGSLAGHTSDVISGCKIDK